MSPGRSTEVRLALVWFLYMGAFGLYFPYWSVYLTENAGLPKAQAGIVLGALSFMGILSQFFWGQIADRTGSRTRVLAVIAFGASLGFLAIYAASGFETLLLANAFFAGFHTAAIPMTVAVCLATLRDRSPHAFGIVRSIGTIGFLVSSFTFPRVLDHIQEARGWLPVPGGPSEPGLELVFPTSATIAVVASLVVLTLPRTGAVSMQAARGDWRALLRHGPYLRLAAFSTVTYFMMHGPMLFFPVLVRSHGGDLTTISNMWVPMIALEVPGLMLSGWLARRVGPKGMIVIGLTAGGLRWALCGFFPSIEVFYASCLLHGVTIAGLMMGTPLYIEAVAPEKLRSTGQGLVAACVHLGAMLSSIAVGQVVDRFGIELPYRVGGVAALSLALLVPWLLPRPQRPAGEDGATPD